MCGGGYYVSPLGLVLLIPIFAATGIVRGVKHSASVIDERVGKIWEFTHPGATQQKLIEYNVRLAMNPKDTQTLMLRSLMYTMQYKYTEAEKDLVQALSLEPKNHMTHYYYGFLLEVLNDPRSMEQYTKAIEHYQKGREPITAEEFVHAKLQDASNTWYQISDVVEDKLYEWKQTLPDPFGLRDQRAKKMMEKKAVSKVVRSCSPTLITKADLYNNRGMAKFRHGEYYEAIEDFKLAIASVSKDQTDHNNSAIYYFNYGQTCYYIHDLAVAIELFSQCIEKSDGLLCANGYAMRSYCYLRLHEDDLAIKDRHKACEIDGRANINQFHYRLLPESVFIHALSFLTQKELVDVSLVSRQFSQIVCHPFLWSKIVLTSYDSLEPQVDFYLNDSRYKGYDKPYMSLATYSSIDQSQLNKMLPWAPHLKSLRLSTYDEVGEQTFLNHCDNLEELIYDICISEQHKDLSHLKKLKKLQLNIQTNSEVIGEMLEGVGHSLEHLSISNSSYSAELLDAIIPVYCKKLKSLTVDHYPSDELKLALPGVLIRNPEGSW